MVTFNFTYDPGVTVQQALGFEIAGRIWSNYLSDPVILNLHVGVSSNLPANVIGGALPGVLAKHVNDFKGCLLQDATSAADQTAASGVALNSRFDMFVNGSNQGISVSTPTMNVTRAGAKAAGVISGNETPLDGVIVMGNLSNSQFHWNYDYTRNSSPASNSLDYLSVVLHEIGHILGFVSGVDKPGLISSTIDQTQIQTYEWQVTERLQYATPLDVFRVDSSNQRNLSYGSTGGAKGFALQSGNTMIAQFATGKTTSFGGDGFQASHWKEQSTALGIMDPAIAPRERSSISNLDLQAFDVIGWNLRNGLSASPFTTTFLNNLRTQAISALATRLGQTTTWINNNLTAVPSTLGGDRTTDVTAMIQASGIYEVGGSGSTSGSTGGKRWMEIFNQMATAQEVYVNFSTVSKMAPLPQSPIAEQTDVENGGSSGGTGGSKPGSGRTWSDKPSLAADASSDALLGVNKIAQLVGGTAIAATNLDTAPLAVMPEVASANVRPVAGTKWTPVAIQLSEAVSASEPSLLTGSSSRQSSGLLPAGLNTLLGVDNNPLAQSSLSAGLMGEIA